MWRKAVTKFHTSQSFVYRATICNHQQPLTHLILNLKRLPFRVQVLILLSYYVSDMKITNISSLVNVPSFTKRHYKLFTVCIKTH